MDSIVLLGAFLTIGWLFLWSLRSGRRRPAANDPSPFAMRSADDYRRRYGDERPF